MIDNHRPILELVGNLVIGLTSPLICLCGVAKTLIILWHKSRFRALPKQIIDKIASKTKFSQQALRKTGHPQLQKAVSIKPQKRSHQGYCKTR